MTSPAIAEELAGAAELSSGKFGKRPVVIVRGTDPAWHTTDDGLGARALIRDEDGDMFGLGARDAAVAAILGDQPVRGLPRDETTSIDTIIDLGLRDFSFERSDIIVSDRSIIFTIAAGAEVSAGALA